MCLWSNDPIATHKPTKKEPMIGYKFLKKNVGYDTNYRSPYKGTAWWDNEHHAGAITKSGNGGNPGIFCFKSIRAAREFALSEGFSRYSLTTVIVKLELWGTVYEHKKEAYWSVPSGYRAQNARIVKDYPVVA